MRGSPGQIPPHLSLPGRPRPGLNLSHDEGSASRRARKGRNHMTPHATTTREQWLDARRDLLAAEKDLTRRADEVARLRRQMPWVRVEKDYVFEGPDGYVSLGELFGGRSQLIVQQFMLAPGWEAGCKSCSYMADHTDGMLPHLAARDIATIVVSRAPLAEIARFRRRMGWQFPWLSSNG